MITVDVVHDLICPWCRIGEHHLEEALRGWKGEPVEIRLLPYQLMPEVPEGGVDYQEHLARKLGRDRLRTIHDRLDSVARPLGIVFDHDRIRRIPDTIRAHATLANVPAERQVPLLRAMQKAYFEDGLDLGDASVLARLGGSVGLTPDEALAAVETADVEGTRALARELVERGITGVPTFIFNGRYQVVGAQPPAALLQALQRLSSHPAAA